MRKPAWRIGMALLFAGGLPAEAAPPMPDPPLPPVRAVPADASAAPVAPLPLPPPPMPPARPRELDGPLAVSPAAPEASRALPMPHVGEVLGPPMPPRPLVTPLRVPQPPVVPPDDELACVRLLTSRKVEARAVTPPVPSAAGCFMPAPVEIAAVLLGDGTRLPLQPPVMIGCPFGTAFADWVREDLAPAFDKAGKPLAALVSTSGYACRGRNNVAGAKVSEHGRGDAVDIGGFRTRDGATVGVKGSGAPLLASVKSTACARFATVLGPGSDGFHDSHLHVDLEPRRHRAKLCQWDLP